MWQALSLRWGIPIEELQERITQREFMYWVAVYRARPFDDEHTTMLAQALIRADMRLMTSSKGQKVNVTSLIPFHHDPEGRSDLERKIDEVL